MSAVPDGFTLPCNTTVTMADVWDARRCHRRILQRSRAKREREIRKTLRRLADEMAGVRTNG